MPVDIPQTPVRTAVPSPGADCCAQPPVQTLESARATQLATLAKALADPIRVQIVDILQARQSDVCQCELQPLFGVSQPTLSHHLRKLADANVIQTERRGVWAYYSIRRETLEVLHAWLS